MSRHLRLAAGFALVLLAAACGEVPTAVPGGDLQRAAGAASIVPGTCTNLAQLNTLAATIFTPGSSPNINSVKGKLKNLDKLVRRGEIVLAQAQATEIVAFVLKKHNQGGLAGTAEQVEAFADAILCFAGFDLDVEEPTNTFLILPSDEPQVVTNIEGTAGIRFPGNPVFEPTLVEFATIPDTFTVAGAGPLDTKLDQYPGFIQITKTSETNAPLAQPVVVGVCANGAIPTEVLDRLRLGHGASAGFEVTPAATADFISCPEQVADAGADPLWKRLASAMLPRQLHAFQQAMRGGVGGTVTEFSPFAPVDPELSFRGGVGGTVTEFTRSAPFLMQSSIMSSEMSLTGTCTTVEGAVGSPLREECRPYVELTTRLGTPFVGVPLSWSVTVGGGVVAANPGTCGTFGATAVNATGVTGRAGICWTLGTVGANQVTATPSLGGDAIEGVTFSPAVFTFDATANPAVGLVFIDQPAPVSPAYPPLTVSVMVVDKNGERVHASTDRVMITLNKNTFDDGRTELNPKTVEGIATTTFTIRTLDSGYQLAASTPFLAPPLAPAISNPFQVVASFAYNIQIFGGNDQTAPAGSTLTTAPRVRVTDRYGNVVAGAGVRWAVVSEGGGNVSAATSVTDAVGETTVSWTVALGTNRLRAYLLEGSLQYTTFTATGTAP